MMAAMAFCSSIQYRLPSLCCAALATAALGLSILSATNCSFLRVEYPPHSPQNGFSISDGISDDIISDFERHNIGVFCASHMFQSKGDTIWILVKSFMIISFVLLGTTFLLAWALATRMRPTYHNWKFLSIVSILTAGFQVPTFLFYLIVPCQKGERNCVAGKGFFFLLWSVILLTFLTGLTQFCDYPKWSNTLNRWKVRSDDDSAHYPMYENPGETFDTDVENQQYNIDPDKSRLIAEQLSKKDADLNMREIPLDNPDPEPQIMIDTSFDDPKEVTVADDDEPRTPRKSRELNMNAPTSSGKLSDRRSIFKRKRVTVTAGKGQDDDEVYLLIGEDDEDASQCLSGMSINERDMDELEEIGSDFAKADKANESYNEDHSNTEKDVRSSIEDKDDVEESIDHPIASDHNKNENLPDPNTFTNRSCEIIRSPSTRRSPIRRMKKNGGKVTYICLDEDGEDEHMSESLYYGDDDIDESVQSHHIDIDENQQVIVINTDDVISTLTSSASFVQENGRSQNLVTDDEADSQDENWVGNETESDISFFTTQSESPAILSPEARSSIHEHEEAPYDLLPSPYICNDQSDLHGNADKQTKRQDAMNIDSSVAPHLPHSYGQKNDSIYSFEESRHVWQDMLENNDDSNDPLLICGKSNDIDNERDHYLMMKSLEIPDVCRDAPSGLRRNRQSLANEDKVSHVATVSDDEDDLDFQCHLYPDEVEV